jgi:toxin ParE1/3/4
MWTHEALLRLREIKRYIAKDNPARAEQFIQKIIIRTDTLIHNPESGRIVPEISQADIREIIYKNYRIVYRVRKEYVEILTVFEGHMRLRIEGINNL